jgi:TnpA family transposase
VTLPLKIRDLSAARQQQLSEVLRLAASIQQGTVTASLILRKLGSYPRQNSLAVALREVGRRVFFCLTRPSAQ